MKNNNCPNCGAVIEPYSCKCQYCGTWYYDLTLFDTVDNKLRYVKFRTEQNGKKLYLTALVRPIIQSVEVKTETADYIYDDHQREFVTISNGCSINVEFECYRDRTTGSLFQIQEGEKG